MNIHPLIQNELNDEQQKATVQMKNCVVAAGAGSGKTRVLAYRYAHLVIEHNYPVESILTLTFTKKATAEMYGRIYATLKDISISPLSNTEQKMRALHAIENFHTARIQTLDSFCSNIVRGASRLYGIRPDFKIDNDAVLDFCKKQALNYMLTYRNLASIQELMGIMKFEEMAESLFVKPIMYSSSIASEIQFTDCYNSQINVLLKEWTRNLDIIMSLREVIQESNPSTIEIFNTIDKYVVDEISLRGVIMPIVENSQKSDFSIQQLKDDIIPLLDSIYKISSLSKVKKENKPIKDEINAIKEAYTILTSLAQYIVFLPQTIEIMPILQKYQGELTEWKRSTGNLTYSDVSTLALKILIEHPEIRKNEKQKTNAIMIDEFQDNNVMQKELLFLLAENIERSDTSVASAEELCPEKLFFVGDEKQSIYKFRGADVGVFRELKNDLGESLSLSTNYRSHPQLISSFNTIFGGYDYLGATESYERNSSSQKRQNTRSVFLQDFQLTENTAFPKFEAEYTKVFSHEKDIDEQDSDVKEIERKRVHICLLDTTKVEQETNESGTDSDPAGEIQSAENIVEAENIAVFTAEKIAHLCSNEGREPKDFAILFRSYSKQFLYEKHLRRLGIPYVAENITNFFGDAPVNDILSFVRLLIYPKDVISFSSLLRSPFVRLSQQETVSCLMHDCNSTNNSSLLCAEAAESLQGKAKERYMRVLNRYEALRSKLRNITCTEIVKELWYIDGYRYETMWNYDVTLFSEFYDFLFHIAQEIDLEGKNLSHFIDYLYDLEKNDEKLEDMNIPLERKGAVQLMSIHKSKGLEFPIVFIANVSTQGRNTTNENKVFIDKTYGPSLNFPPLSSIANCQKNYFFNCSKIIENQMSEAELRRVLYVAMTRAENELYITGSYSVNKDLKSQLLAEGLDIDSDAAQVSKDVEKNSYTILRALFAKKSESKQKEKNNSQVNPTYCIQNDTLFAFLLPIIAQYDEDTSPFSIEKIERKTRDDLHNADTRRQKASVQSTQQRLLPLFKKATVIETDTLESPYRSPSHLTQATDFENIEVDNRDNGENNIKELDDIISTKAEDSFDYSHFGTIAHAYAESLFTKKSPEIPVSITGALNKNELDIVCSIAETMTHNFSNSPIGQEALNADWQQCEHNFMLLIKKSDDKSIFIKGQIDLVYERSDGKLVIIDYKTDSIEDPMHHVPQLAAYRRAVQKIFGKEKEDVSCMLYYLRSGNCVDITNLTENIDLEEILFS